MQTECVWYTNVEGINPIDMYTGMISAQQRAKTPVAVGASIGSQMYFFNFSVECKETIYVKNYYDSTIDDDILAKIDVAVAFLNTVYNEYCLYFEVDGPPTFYAEAGVEICGYGATRGCKEVSSNCGSDCSQHHKNVDRIAGELMEKWEPNHIVVMWSNVEHSGFYCYEDSLGNHATVGMTPALVSPFNVPGNEDYLPVVQILTIDDGEANEDMAVKLAHEVAHTLGLLEIRNDAYGDGISDHVYGGSAECIMGVIDSARIYDMLVGGQSAFCDYCKQKLHEEIDEVDLYEPREG